LATLRLLAAGTGPGGQSGETLCCAFTPDGAFVISGGWDGHLRCWETGGGAHVTAFKVSDKPVSACTVAPDGKSIVSGSLAGMFAVWDSVAHTQKLQFLAHTRPVSSIMYSSDGKTVATSSWDNTVNVWTSLVRHDARTLTGHRDIVSGCAFTPDGQSILSWSHDMCVYLWELGRSRPAKELMGHTDRLLAGSVSPDGKLAATGARDGTIKLWDLQAGTDLATAKMRGEARGLLFSLDGQTLIAIDHHGRLTLHSLPALEQQSELLTRTQVQSAALSPVGNQIAIACSNGMVRLIAVDGFDAAPLLVSLSRTSKRTASTIQKLFGKYNMEHHFHCVCPACRHSFEVPEGKAGLQISCAKCKRKLRTSGVVRTEPEK